MFLDSVVIASCDLEKGAEYLWKLVCASLGTTCMMTCSSNLFRRLLDVVSPVDDSDLWSYLRRASVLFDALPLVQTLRLTTNEIPGMLFTRSLRFATKGEST